MTSKLTPKPQSPNPAFPALYEYAQPCWTGMVVLFSSRDTGTVLAQGAGPYSLGYHSQGWSQCHSQLNWKPYHGDVILSSSEP